MAASQTLTDFHQVDNFDTVDAADINPLISASLNPAYNSAETLTATRQLVDNDVPIQTLTPSGADRDVKLPVEASSNHPFIIFNPTGTSYNLVIKDDSGATTLLTLAAGEAGLFLTDGSEWRTTSGGASALADLTDVNLTSPSDGQALTYDNASGKWVNTTLTSTLAGLTDTTITTPADNEFLRYNGSAWVNESVVVDPTLRILSGPASWDDDFSGGLSAPPSGWAWAGSPFVTPDTIAYDSKIMSWRDTTATAMRNFLYKSWTPGTPTTIDLITWLSGTFFTNAFFQGIRIDDGTDNNYCEFGQYRSTTGNPIEYWTFHRVGGGSVVSAELDTTWQMVMPPPFMVISMALRGTFWSNWDYRGQLYGDFAYQKIPTGATGKTWTPSRYGITSRRLTYAWDTTKLARFTVETT